MVRRIICGLLFVTLWIPAAVLCAAPVIRPDGIQNAASFAGANPAPYFPPDTFVSSVGIAPGSIFVIRGTELGPGVSVWGMIPYRDRLPDTIGGSTVTIRSPGAGIEVQAWLLYSSSQQINAILPSTVPVGNAEVIVSYRGESSRPVPINILPSAPGLFAVGQNGWGSGVIQNYESDGNQPLNQLTRPARPGQYLVLWGTGLGAIDGADNGLPPVGSLDLGFEVRIGGVALTPDYAGRAPGFPGVDQINVRLPDDGSIEEGCYVPVQVRSGEYASRPVLMALEAEANGCSHPWGLSHEQLARLDAGLTLTTASMGVSASFLDTMPGMNLHAHFASLTPLQVATAPPWSFPANIVAVWGTDECSMTTVLSMGSPFPPGGVPPEDLPVIGLDAGGHLFLGGPDGRSVALVKSEWFPRTGAYQPGTEAGKIPDEFMTGGEWTLESAGGADVPAFRSAFTLPPPVHVDLPDSIDRSQDLVVSWDPVPGSEGSVMRVHLVVDLGEPIIVSTPSGELGFVRRLEQLVCSAPASAGSIAISSADLLGLSPTEDGRIGVELDKSQPGPVVFSIPGIDYASFTPANSHYRTAVIQ